VVAAERDAWILVAARWPESIREVMPEKHAQLDDPQLVRLYRLGSQTLETDAGDDSRLLDLVRERGWASWTKTRPERLAEPPG
jgi:hypothetical protein